MEAPNGTAGPARTTSSAEIDVLYGANYYDQQLHREHWFHNNAAKRALRWHEVLHMLAPSVHDRLLEIGCASGEHTLRLAGLCKEVVGVDLAAAAIERARERATAAGVSNVTFFRLDASNLDRFPTVFFDKIAAIDFTEHVNDEVLAQVLRECRRVLRPGGRLAIFTPCASHYVERLKSRSIILKQSPGHFAVRGPAAYRRLLQQGGFSIDSLYFSPSTYPLFGVLDRWFASAPIVGPLFRFRICIVASPAVTS
jgi:cyclopropane fatty-acyl-phospholipid synthase-like methyltransferase